MRPLLALALPLLLVSLAALPVSASTTSPVPLDGQRVEEAVETLFEELVLLHQAGAVVDDVLVEDMRVWWEDEFDDPDELLDVLLEVDEYNAILLGDALSVGATPSTPLRSVLERFDTATVDALWAGQESFLTATPYLDAITDLLRRGGVAPVADRDPDEHAVIRSFMASLDDDMGLNLGQFADDAVAPDAAPDAAGSPDRVTPTDGDGLPVGVVPLGLGILLLLVLLGLVAVVRRNRGGDVPPASSPPPPPPAPTGPTPPRHTTALTDALETSRRMTAALDAEEVHRIAVRDAVRLTGAEQGAFLSFVDRTLHFTATTDPDYFAAVPTNEGVLARVIGSGVAAQTVVHDDPCLAQLPMALAAAPVISDGGVVGALVVLRAPSRPFGKADLDTLELLTPITGSALAAAATHRGAVTASEVDGLTSLLNRRRLDDDMASLPPTAQVAFAMVDVDHFKVFNDTNGHASGDEALRLVAATLRDAVRAGDVVYRYGGEEFAVLLAESDAAEAGRVLERARSAVEAVVVPDEASQPGGRVTVSVGVALRRPTEPLAELQVRADGALYAAKETGRNRVAWAEPHPVA